MSCEKGHGNAEHSQNEGLFFLMKLQLSVDGRVRGPVMSRSSSKISC